MFPLFVLYLVSLVHTHTHTRTLPYFLLSLFFLFHFVFCILFHSTPSSLPFFPFHSIFIHFSFLHLLIIFFLIVFLVFLHSFLSAFSPSDFAYLPFFSPSAQTSSTSLFLILFSTLSIFVYFLANFKLLNPLLFTCFLSHFILSSLSFFTLSFCSYSSPPSTSFYLNLPANS